MPRRPKRTKIKECIFGAQKNTTANEAKRLCISQDLLLNLYAKGIIPGVKLTQRIVLFDPAKTDAALERLGDVPLSEL